MDSSFEDSFLDSLSEESKEKKPSYENDENEYFNQSFIHKNSKIIAKRFLIQKRIGVGTFGRVYKAIDIQTKEFYAIKIQKKLPDKKKFLLLQKEAEVVRDLSNEEGFPKLKIFFKESKKGFLVMSYLGENLANLFHSNVGKFSLKTVCMLALQLLARIETLHSKFYLHRDIKLENITIGPNGDYKTVYLIDFGLAKSYLDEDGRHIRMRTDKGMVGTVRYSSIYTQQGIEQSRRDDLISIGYLLIYLLKEELPWQRVKINYENPMEKEQKNKNILQIKMETRNETLCENIPKQFLAYMNYVKSLEFEQAPDYKMLKNLFHEIMTKFNYENDFEFDWRKHFNKNINSMQSTMNLEEKKKCNFQKFQNFSCETIGTVRMDKKGKHSKYQDTSKNTFKYAHYSNNSNQDSNVFASSIKYDANINSPFGLGFLRKCSLIKSISVNGNGINLNARKIFQEEQGLKKYQKILNPSFEEITISDFAVSKKK